MTEPRELLYLLGYQQPGLAGGGEGSSVDLLRHGGDVLLHLGLQGSRLRLQVGYLLRYDLHHTLQLQYNTTQHNTTQYSKYSKYSKYSTVQYSTVQYSTALQSTAQHSTALHCTAQHYTAHSAQHTAQHYIVSAHPSRTCRK